MQSLLPWVRTKLREDALIIILIIVDPKVILGYSLLEREKGGFASLICRDDGEFVPK